MKGLWPWFKIMVPMSSWWNLLIMMSQNLEESTSRYPNKILYIWTRRSYLRLISKESHFNSPNLNLSQTIRSLWRPIDGSNVLSRKYWWHMRSFFLDTWNALHVHVHFLALRQNFWYFTRSRSREIQVHSQNPAKFTKTHKIPWNLIEILSNTCLYNIFETYLSY